MTQSAHRESLLFTNRQNSFSCPTLFQSSTHLTPKPPSSFGRQIFAQRIVWDFLVSSAPQKCYGRNNALGFLSLSTARHPQATAQSRPAPEVSVQAVINLSRSIEVALLLVKWGKLSNRTWLHQIYSLGYPN